MNAMTVAYHEDLEPGDADRDLDAHEDYDEDIDADEDGDAGVDPDEDTIYELNVDEMDAILAAIENAEVDVDAFQHPLADALTPYRSERVVDYAGSPGAWVSCPNCGIDGKSVDSWGAYWCENCGYTNTEPHPTRR
jgi:hypothetical protein